MKHFTCSLRQNFSLFQTKRLVFAGEAAPPSPETFKAPDKKSDAEIASEVGPISPSQIASQAATRTGFIKTKYTNYTMILAGLMSGTGRSSSTTGASQTSNSQNAGKQDEQALNSQINNY